MSDFFRKEVFDHKKTKSWDGGVALPNTFSLKVLMVILILILIAIVIIFRYGSYTERRAVMGYLTPVNGVIKVLSPSTGVVDSIKVQNNQTVKINDELLTIVNKQYGSEGDYNDQLNQNLEEQLYVTNNQEPLIMKDYDERENIAKLGIEELKKKIEFNSDIRKNKEEQIRILESTYRGYLNIGIEGAISDLEMQDVQGQIINLKSELYRIQESESSLLNQIESKRLELKQLSNQEQKEMNELQSKKISLQQLLLELEKDTTKTVKAPAAGRLTALNIHKNQIVNTSQLLLSIIPFDNKLKVNLLIPPSDVGFIEVGNKVAIRYDAFPYQKYGQAKGTIASISKTTVQPSDLADIGGFYLPVSEDTSFYIVDVTIDKQFLMIDGNKQALDTGMTLSADIRLENRKLYQWILEPLISLRERNK